jgi:hypothetical protein
LPARLGLPTLRVYASRMINITCSNHDVEAKTNSGNGFKLFVYKTVQFEIHLASTLQM